MLKQFIFGLSAFFLTICKTPDCAAQADLKNTYSQLKRANSAFEKKPDSAIKMVDEVYKSCINHKNYIGAVKSLNYLAEYYYRLHDFSKVQAITTKEWGLAL